MSECTWKQRISAWYDGEVEGQEGSAIAAHVKQCGECQAELESLKALSQAMASWARPEMSEAAGRRLHAAVERAQFRALERLAGALGAMAATIAIVAVLWSSDGANSATAAGPPEQWEQAAVQLTATTASGELTIAEWVVADLSRGEINVE